MEKSLNLKSFFQPIDGNNYYSFRISATPNLNQESSNLSKNDDVKTVNYYFNIVFNDNALLKENKKENRLSVSSPNKQFILEDQSVAPKQELNSITYTNEDNQASIISLPSGNIRDPKLNKYKSQKQQKLVDSSDKKQNYLTRLIYLPTSKISEQKFDQNQERLNKSFDQVSITCSYNGDEEDNNSLLNEEVYSNYFHNNSSSDSSELNIHYEKRNNRQNKTSSFKRSYAPYSPTDKFELDNSSLSIDESVFDFNEEQKNYVIKQLSEIAKSRATVEPRLKATFKVF